MVCMTAYPYMHRMLVLPSFLDSFDSLPLSFCCGNSFVSTREPKPAIVELEADKRFRHPDIAVNLAICRPYLLVSARISVPLISVECSRNSQPNDQLSAHHAGDMCVSHLRCGGWDCRWIRCQRRFPGEQLGRPGAVRAECVP